MRAETYASMRFGLECADMSCVHGVITLTRMLQHVCVSVTSLLPTRDMHCPPANMKWLWNSSVRCASSAVSLAARVASLARACLASFTIVLVCVCRWLVARTLSLFHAPISGPPVNHTDNSINENIVYIMSVVTKCVFEHVAHKRAQVRTHIHVCLFVRLRSS